MPEFDETIVKRKKYIQNSERKLPTQMYSFQLDYKLYYKDNYSIYLLDLIFNIHSNNIYIGFLWSIQKLVKQSNYFNSFFASEIFSQKLSKLWLLSK